MISFIIILRQIKPKNMKLVIKRTTLNRAQKLFINSIIYMYQVTNLIFIVIPARTDGLGSTMREKKQVFCFVKLSKIL